AYTELAEAKLLLNSQLYQSEAQLAEIQTTLTQGTTELAAVRREAETARIQATAQIVMLEGQLAELGARFHAIVTSTSWRMLEPARRIGQQHPRTTRFSRRALKLLWWTATGRLFGRLREYRTYRANLRLRALRVVAASGQGVTTDLPRSSG